MMDKAYILGNGIIELYLLGELDIEHELILERLLLEDKELKGQFDSIEANLEAIALENAIDPPKAIKENLMNALGPAQSQVVSLPSKNPFKSYLAIAASIAAFLLIGSIWMYSQWDNTKQKLQIVEEQNSEFNKNIKVLNRDLKSATAYLEVLNSTDTKQYILKGNALSPEAKMVSYVNHSQKQVLVNTSELPELDAQHDYQMWADVEGKMIDMGVIKKGTSLLAMNYIDHAESLNITIEPLGGSDHPTVSQLITNVYL